LKEWRNCGEPIIALKVKDWTTMDYIMNVAKKKGVLCGWVVDAGLTEIPAGTVSVGFIGPDIVEKIDKITGQLKCL
jgi:PTH2 family peptidyl-tRNA hydrolase